MILTALETRNDNLPNIRRRAPSGPQWPQGTDRIYEYGSNPGGALRFWEVVIMATKVPGLRLRGKTWWAWFRADGRQVRQSLKTSDLRIAKRRLHELRHQADVSEDALSNRYPWARLKERFLIWAAQTKVSGGSDYARDLRTIEAYQTIQTVNQIDFELVHGYRDWRICHGIAPSTVNKETGTLYHVLSKGVQWKLLRSNPLKGLDRLQNDEPRKVRRSLTEAELRRLFEVSGDRRLIWETFAVTGLRSAECCRARFTWIDWGRHVLTVPRRSKSHREREIPLTDILLQQLAGIHQQHPEQELLFPTARGKQRRSGVLLRLFYQDCAKAGISDAQPHGSVDIHAIRCTFTTLSIDRGARPNAVQSILGHANLSITMKSYNRTTDRSRREAVSVLGFGEATAPEHIIELDSTSSAQIVHNTAENPSVSREKLA